MRLTDAVRRFREAGAVSEATTSAMVAPTRSAQGHVFYGRRGLATIEKERQARMGKRSRCRGYDPKCRDAEWDVKAPVGGVALLRRT